MKLEVRKLNAQRQFTGDFEYEYEPSPDMCLIPLCRIEGNVKVKGGYEIYDDDSVGINFDVKFVIKGQCSYCLADAEESVEKHFEVLYVKEDDPDNYRYDGIRLDLDLAVNDAILFSQPEILLCRADCTGVDLNKK